MLLIQNERLAIYAPEDARSLSIVDKVRSTKWQLDNDTLLFGGEIAHNDKPIAGYKEKLYPLKPRKAEVADDTLRIVYAAGEVDVTYEYRLGEDYVGVTLLPCALPVASATLPGAFFPTGEKKQLVLPIMQGMLWSGEGHSVDRMCISGGHDNFAMMMYGIMGDSGGLTFAAIDAVDSFWRYVKQDDGTFYVENIQISSLGSMRYPRNARLYPTEPSIVAVAKTYREHVKRTGRFISWEEKIKKRPALERLFGALMCFVGYCEDDLDYAAEFKKLKDYGFDRALIYPVRMHTYSMGFKMGGRNPIWLSDKAIADIKGLGYDVCPWSWINEAVNDGTDETNNRYRLNSDGERILGWQIDDFVWDKCCSTKMAEFESTANDRGMEGMTWDHFDVLTCAQIGECYATDHAAHLNRPMSRQEDLEYLRKTLVLGQDGRKAVSSESFNDLFSLEYDLGSVKAFPINFRRPFTAIPLTALIYHDSIAHTWWEPHNYNTYYFNRVAAGGYIEYGGGLMRLMAACDALMGCMPDVFPFGSQYGWTGRDNQTRLYSIRFEDPMTQAALEIAKPVADLHRIIGKQEMVNFEILSADGCVQRTTFADGTRVVANFSNYLRGDCAETPPIDAYSWATYKQ